MRLNMDQAMTDISEYNIWETSSEYAAVRDYYGDKCARRSGVPYIKHINEGIYILRHIGASENAERAWCLHPLIQLDEDLAINIKRLDTLELTSDPYVLALAFEYRNVANRALAKHNITSPDQIELSPITDVNDMLVADKIQNRRDFVQYHYGTHPNSEALLVYFDCWLKRLGVDETFYVMADIAINTQRHR